MIVEPPAKPGICDRCGELAILSEVACADCDGGTGRFVCRPCFDRMPNLLAVTCKSCDERTERRIENANTPQDRGGR